MLLDGFFGFQCQRALRASEGELWPRSFISWTHVGYAWMHVRRWRLGAPQHFYLMFHRSLLDGHLLDDRESQLAQLAQHANVWEHTHSCAHVCVYIYIDIYKKNISISSLKLAHQIRFARPKMIFFTPAAAKLPCIQDVWVQACHLWMG